MSQRSDLRAARQRTIDEGIPAEAWDKTLAGQWLAVLDALDQLIAPLDHIFERVPARLKNLLRYIR